MDYKRYTVEDFVLDKTFREWVRKPNKESNIWWEDYIRKNPLQIGKINEARKIILNIPDLFTEMPEYQVEDLWESINSQIEKTKDLESIIVPIHSEAVIKRYDVITPWWKDYRKLGRIAAVTLFFISIVLTLFLVPDTPKEVTEIITEKVIKKTHWGIKSTIYLSDGSEVILNSGSEIEYEKFFSDDERLVVLKGEAFFNVSKDSLRPFRVKCGDVITEALGTSFNINAYESDQKVDVSLVTGKVNVSVNNEAGNEVILLPGERAVYQRSSKALQRTRFDQLATIGWKDGIIYYKDASLKQVFDKLSQWYGIEFKFRNRATKPWKYNGEYRNLDLDNVLGAIGYTMDFTYEIQKDVVWIKFSE